MSKPVVLLIDDEPAAATQAREALGAEYDLLVARDIGEGEVLLRNRPVEVLICEDSLPGETGIMFLARTRNEYPQTRRILMTAQLDPEVLVYAINEAGLYRFIAKPFQPEELRRLVAEGIAAHAREREAEHALKDNQRLRAELKERAEPARESSPASFWARFLFIGAIVLGMLFVLGVLLLLVLYFLKSVIGIDLFRDRHLYNILGLNLG
jgi:response regulator RpfG family c-di-GMP phosphodiesterase